MNKAKLMLSAIAIFAVVGAAFAFNASKFDSRVIYTGTGGVCTTPISPATITSTGTTLVNASTSSLASNCPSTYTVALPSDN